MRKEKEKNKAKERKKRVNRKYGQAKLKHSKKGYPVLCHCGSRVGSIDGVACSCLYQCRNGRILYWRAGTCYIDSCSDRMYSCSERAKRTREKLSYM